MDGKLIAVCRGPYPGTTKFNLPPKSELPPRLVELRFEQLQGIYRTLAFLPPAETGIAGIEPGGKPSANEFSIESPASLVVKPQPGAPLHSLNLWVKDSQPEALAMEALIGGKAYPMECFEADSGRIYSIALGKLNVSGEIQVRIAAPARSLVVQRVWVCRK